MTVKSLMVVGGGLMGRGIAQVSASSGLKVFLKEVNEELCNKAEQAIEKRLERNVEKGRMTAGEKDEVLANLTFITDYQEAGEIELVIEAVPEKMELKKRIFQELDESLDSNVVLATNTSALPVTEIASVTGRPEKVIGAHFFFPVPLMKLLEITPGLATAQETTGLLYEYSEKINKTPVRANDYPGFIVNRILVPMMNEAINLVMEGVKPEDIDNGMKLGANHPMGPIALADFVGLDTLLATMEGLYHGFRDSKYRPSPLLVKKVQAGQLGRKTGKGFYDYQ